MRAKEQGALSKQIRSAIGRRGPAMAIAVALGALALPLAGGTQTAARVGFHPVADYGTGGPIPAALAVGDINGDGAPDLVTAGTPSGGGGGQVSILAGDRAGRFGPATQIPAGAHPAAVVTADLAPNPGVDIVVADAGADGGAGSVVVLARQPAGGFAAPVSYPSGGTAPSALAVGDLNGDGRLDLVVTNGSSGDVAVLLGAADGTFGPARTLTLPTGAAPSAVAAADLNGDGKPDLAVADRASDTVSIWAGDGQGGFRAPVSLPVGRAPAALAVADLNGDRRPDLVVANAAANTVTILLGSSTGDFAAPAAATGTGTTAAVGLVVADFDADGHGDVAVADGGADRVAVLLGDGAGALAAAVPFSFGATTAGASSLAAAPLDGDADIDLVVARAGAASLGVLLNNAIPTAKDDSYVVDEDGTLTITAPGVMSNDPRPEDERLTATLEHGAAHGTVSLGSDGGFTYHPTADFNGTDSFTYTVSDGAAQSPPAKVELVVNAVNDPPKVADDQVGTAEDTAVDIDVLHNDSDVEGDPLTIVNAGRPDNGGSATCTDHSCTYTPAPDYHGPAAFKYTVADGKGGAATGTVHITVQPVPDPPRANDDDATTPEDNLITLDVLDNDYDVDGDQLAITSNSAPKTFGSTVVCSQTSCTYSPGPNFNGVDTFTYTVSDGTGNTATAKVTVTITPQNEIPQARADQYKSAEDQTLSVPAADGVLHNDQDGDGDPLEAALVAGTTRGTLHLAPDGSFSYTPLPESSGTDTFTYQAYDGKADSDPVKVTITVAAVNDPPVARPDKVLTAEDRAVDISVLANDSDPDSENLSAKVAEQPVHGQATCRRDTCTYRPIAHYVGDDSFRYTADDGSGGTDTTTVAVTVTAAGPRGYWLLGNEGSLYTFGLAPEFGDPPATLDGDRAVDLKPSPSSNGYWVLDDRGRVHPFGDAKGFGSVDPFSLGTGDEAKALVLTASGAGYWVVTAAGRVFPFGDAAAFGDLTDRPPAAPILDATATPNGGGYYLVGADGEVFAFGNAVPLGSAPGRSNAPIVSIAADPDGRGYWLAAADGGVFAFDAPFRGSMGADRLNAPVTGVATYGTGYLLVAEDGGVFVFSERPFYGSLGDRPPLHPVTSGVIF